MQLNIVLQRSYFKLDVLLVIPKYIPIKRLGHPKRHFSSTYIEVHSAHHASWVVSPELIRTWKDKTMMIHVVNPGRYWIG